MEKIRRNLLFRVVAITVTVTFFWQQLVWATGEPYGQPINNDENRSGFLTAEELAQAQARQEEFIAYLQAVEDGGAIPTENLLSVTTEAGDILHYSGDTLKYIERPDGSILDTVGLDAAGELLNSTVRYSDGSILIIENGKNKSFARPDGTVIHYNTDGLIEEEVLSDGLVLNYSYEKDASGNVTKTTVTSGRTVSEYDAGGTLTKVTKSDGTILEYADGIPTKITKADGSFYAFARTDSTAPDGSAEIKVRLSQYGDASGTIYNYEGDTVISVTLSDGTIYNYEDGLITNRAYSDLTVATYIREYDSASRPLRLVIKEPSGQAATYLYNELSTLAALGIDTNLPATTPFNKPTSQKITASGTTTTGVVTTNGTYLYVKRWGTASGNNNFIKIGTGLNGTVAGQNYGTLSSSYTSYSATYYSDGYIYNPISSSSMSLEKINTSTGARTTVAVSAGLIERSTGKVKTGYSLITSDGRYIYNVAYHIDNGSSTTYNGWTVKVFDPKNSWQVVKTYTVGTASYYTNGVVADGVYLYFLEWTNTDSARVTMSRISDGAIVKTYNVNQGQTKVINGQYDWVNNRIWLGAYSTNGIYYYNGLVQTTNLSSINTSGFFTSAAATFPDRAAIDSDVQFSELTYTTDFSLKKAALPDGTVVNYSDGLIVSVIDSEGNLVDYAYQNSSLGNILNLTVTKDGLTRDYEVYGDLSHLSGGGVDLGVTDSAIERVEKDDGTLIENAIFDENNNIISGKITKVDGVIAIYDGGFLRELDLPDGTKFYYDALGAITRYINVRNLVYDYSTIMEGAEVFTLAQILDLATVEDEEEPIFLKYNSDDKIVQLMRKNGAVINYTYNKDAAGEIIEMIVNDGKVISTYDGNNNILLAEILPTADDPKTTRSEYEYSRIRRVYKDSGLIYRYTYEFDSNGREITVIEDVATGDVKRYKDELLVSVNDHNDLITSYEYDADKKISRAIVARSGKLIDEYTYIYDAGGLTTIEDVAGIKRTYDNSNKLIRLEEKGRTYTYSYDSTDEATIQELTRVVDDAGTIVNYANGSIETIVKPDGTLLKDVVLSDANEVVSYTIEKDAAKYFIKGAKITKQIKPDGTTIEYYPNGWAKSLTAAGGQVTNYEYDVPATDPVVLEGATVDAELTDGNLRLASSPDTISSLLLHLDGDNGATSSIDSSTHGYPVSFNGNAHLDMTNVKFGTSALALDGNSDYLTLADSDDWSFGQGKFTADFWVNFNTLQDSILVSQEQESPNHSLWSIYYNNDAGKLGFHAKVGGSWDNGIRVTTPWVPAPNTWYHVSVVRNGTTSGDWFIFIDGVSKTLTKELGAYNTTITNVSSVLGIGRRIAYDESSFNGWLDEIRISKGLARWTANFTPQTSAYGGSYKNQGSLVSSPIELGAKELKSISWNEILPAGTDAAIQTRTGDSLNPDDGTWSAWSTPLFESAGSLISSPVRRYIQYKANISTSDSANTPRLSNVRIGYVRGYGDTLDATADARLTGSIDPSQNLLLHFNGANGTRTATDSSAYNHTVNFYGDTHLDTSITRFGTSSVALDGRGDYIGLASSGDWNFGTGDFTIEEWFNVNHFDGANNRSIIAIGDIYSDTGAFAFSVGYSRGYMGFNYNKAYGAAGDIRLDGLLINENTWHHAAVSRRNGVLYLIFDGVSLASFSVPETIGRSDKEFWIGRSMYAGNSANYMSGNLDEVRISKGTARYVSTFTLPESEYPNTIYAASATSVSDAIELNATQLNSISWTEVLPAGTDATIETRTGDTASPDDGTWSAWSGSLSDPAGSSIASPAAKYLQYRINLSTTDQSKTPEVSNIRIDYIGMASGSEVVYVDEYVNGALTNHYAPDAAATAALDSKALPVAADINSHNADIPARALPADAPFKAEAFRADLLKQVTLADGTLIKYFNNKPLLITKADSTRIDNIVLEKYNTAIYDYRVENDLLISYENTARDKVIVSFTATNASGDTYIFKDNVLTQIKYASGSTVDNPTPDAYATGLFDLLESAFSPDSLTGDKEYESSDVSLSITRDEQVTYFINGKMASTYQRYSTGELELLMDYVYDESGNLMLVRLPYARNNLESEIAYARFNIALEKANCLRNLAIQKSLAISQIQTQVQSVRDQINVERTRLQPMLYQQVQRASQGCWGVRYYTETVEVPEVRNALNQLNEQERQLNIEEANAYAQLDSEIAQAEAGLAADEALALAEVNRQEAEFEKKIIEEETTPVLLEYYREILGRDPDDTETQAWLAKVSYNAKIDTNELKSSLQSSTERVSQQALVTNLKSRINTFLADYLTLTQAERDAILGSLGLTAQDVVPLNQEEVNGILAFLDRQNVHFGRSAFVSLEYLLKDAGISYNFEDLAFKTIIIDILVGAINSLSDEKLLELSMYSLSKVASLYGLTLYNTKLNFDDLVAAYNASGKQIAHLKNNHFVVILNIAADGSVTYIELNRGQNGHVWTASKEKFLESWTGYAITKTQPQDASKIISTWEAQRVKGSCLMFLIPLIAFIAQAVVGVATLAIGAITAVVGTIGTLIGGIVAGIGQLFAVMGSFLGQIGGFLFEAVKFVGVGLLKTMGAVFGGSLFGGAAAGSVAATGGLTSTLTTVGAALGKTVVLGALNFGISKGLESLGVNSTITGLVSSFLTGGVGGFLNCASFLAGGLQGLAMTGISQLGEVVGIPPEIGSIIGLAAGSMISAGINGVDVTRIIDGRPVVFHLTGLEAIASNIGTTILPNVASELAYYGVQRLGESIGIDPRISYLAGVGIRSTINAGLTHEFMPDVIWGSVTQGLLQGVTNIGLNFATEELGISPLLANIGFSAISGAINAGIQAATGGSQDVFGSLFQTYKDNALTFLGYGDPSNAWQQAAYISQILDFSNIVQERGLVDALNTYGAGFFNAVAVSNIMQSGYTFGDYFAEKLQTGQYTTRILDDGTEVKVVTIEDNQSNTISDTFFQEKGEGESRYWDLIGGEEYSGGNSYLGWGDFGVDAYGKLGYTDAEIYAMFDSDIQYQRIVGGQQAYAEIKDSLGNTLLVIEPTAGGHFNVYDSYGDYVDAKINTLLSGKAYSFDDALLKYYQELDSTNSTSLFDVDLSNLGTMGLFFNGLSLSSNDIANYNFTDAQKQQITYVLLNGIGNPLGVPPSYMRGLEVELAHADPSGASINSIAMFPWSGSTDAKVDNVVTWIGNAYFWGHELRDDIVNSMLSQFNGQIPSNMTGLAYSGSGDPLIQAVNANPSWDMKGMVLVNTPLGFGRQITNLNVKNVIMIGGTGDPLSEQGFQNQNFDNNTNLNVYKIALVGVGHTQFSYDPDAKNIDPVCKQAAKFSAYMTALANNQENLNNFLIRNTEGITYNASQKIYYVDLNKVTYDNQ